MTKIEKIINVIKTEEELSRPMPEDMWEMIKHCVKQEKKKEMELLFRIVVKTTKERILRRIENEI